MKNTHLCFIMLRTLIYLSVKKIHQHDVKSNYFLIKFEQTPEQFNRLFKKSHEYRP